MNPARFHAQIEVNSFGNGHFKRFHVGFSICDHSCHPDAIVSFEDERHTVLRPLRPAVDFSDLRKVPTHYVIWNMNLITPLLFTLRSRSATSMLWIRKKIAAGSWSTDITSSASVTVAPTRNE